MLKFIVLILAVIASTKARPSIDDVSVLSDVKDINRKLSIIDGDKKLVYGYKDPKSEYYVVIYGLLKENQNATNTSSPIPLLLPNIRRGADINSEDPDTAREAPIERLSSRRSLIPLNTDDSTTTPSDDEETTPMQTDAPSFEEPSSDPPPFVPPGSDAPSFEAPSSDPPPFVPPGSDPPPFIPPGSDPPPFIPPGSDRPPFVPSDSDDSSFVPPDSDPLPFEPPRADLPPFSAPRADLLPFLPKRGDLPPFTAPRADPLPFEPSRADLPQFASSRADLLPFVPKRGDLPQFASSRAVPPPFVGSAPPPFVSAGSSRQFKLPGADSIPFGRGSIGASREVLVHVKPTRAKKAKKVAKKSTKKWVTKARDDRKDRWIPIKKKDKKKTVRRWLTVHGSSGDPEVDLMMAQLMTTLNQFPEQGQGQELRRGLGQNPRDPGYYPKKYDDFEYGGDDYEVPEEEMGYTPGEEMEHWLKLWELNGRRPITRNYEIS